MKSINHDVETIEHLSPVAARMMLAALPEHIRKAFERRAQEIDSRAGEEWWPVTSMLRMSAVDLLPPNVALNPDEIQRSICA